MPHRPSSPPPSRRSNGLPDSVPGSLVQSSPTAPIFPCAPKPPFRPCLPRSRGQVRSLPPPLLFFLGAFRTMDSHRSAILLPPSSPPPAPSRPLAQPLPPPLRCNPPNHLSLSRIYIKTCPYPRFLHPHLVTQPPRHPSGLWRLDDRGVILDLLLFSELICIMFILNDDDADTGYTDFYNECLFW